MNEDKLWGVLFEDSGSEYLVSIAQSEEDAHDMAREEDQKSFEHALDGAEGGEPEPIWENFDGMHYAAPIPAELAAAAADELARGLAVRVV